MRPVTYCSVDGCETRHYGRGFCAKHYKRWKIHGDPLGSAPRPPMRLCSIPGCGQRHRGRGFCDQHLSRFKRHGDPMVVKRVVGRRWLDPDGYVHVGRKREHRMVMEQVLGRPLRRDETVHHINGNRSDNRPENLELWTSSHPSGQRVSDVLAWARDIVTRYG